MINPLNIKIDSKLIITSILTFLTFMNLNIPNYNMIKLLMIMIVAVYIVMRYNTQIFMKYKFINLLAIAFCLIVMYSAFINRNNLERNPLFSGIGYVGIFIEGFLFFQIHKEKNELDDIYNIIYKIFLCVTVIVDLLLFLPGKGYYNDGYLIGTKFTISYIHIFLFALYLLTHKKNIMKSLIIPLVGIFASFIVDCSTGLVANALLIILFCIFRYIKKKKFSIIVFLFAMWSSYMFIYWYKDILKVDFIETFIIDFLERDITLTNRTTIYARLPELLNRVWDFGYGYGSSYEVGMLYGFPNPQNGVANWIWQFGIYATLILIITFTYIVFKAKFDDKNKIGIIGVMAAIYVFMFISTIEISLGQSFLGLFAILFSLGDYEKSKVRFQLF